jgi:hypothetical protein
MEEFKNKVTIPLMRGSKIIARMKVGITRNKMKKLQ